MQINNEHQKYKYPHALKSVNFKGQTIPIKQITDKGLKIASGAIGAIGLAGVAMNNSLNFSNEIEDKLQGLTKQQIDLCTNSDGEISIEAIELLKKLQKSVVNSENSDAIINRLMLSCKNYKGSWSDKEYTTICEEAISLANKMLDLGYEPNLIHCTLSNANGSGTHDSMRLTALTKYIECYPQIDKRKIGDLALGLNKKKIDFLNKVLELKINNKISLSESELELLMRFGSEIQGSSNFIIKSLETGKTPSKIIENLAYFQNLHNNDSSTKEVLKSLITSEKLFDDPTALLIVRNYLDKPYMRESREQILSMIKSMIEDNSFSTKQLKDTVNIGKYGIGLQYIENREYLTGCGKSEIDVLAENTKELISELYNEDSIPKELLNPNKIYSKLKTESK